MKKINKYEVQDSFEVMSRKLGFTALILNESMFKEELPQLLAEAYIKDYRPEESILLIEAYKLLQETGSYYNDNKKGV